VLHNVSFGSSIYYIGKGDLIRPNMAKKNRKQKKSPSEKVAKDEDAITWDDIAAMSDSDDEKGVDNAIELNTKAKNLKDAITKNIGDMMVSLKRVNKDDEEFEEDVLDGSSSEEEESDNKE